MNRKKSMRGVAKTFSTYEHQDTSKRGMDARAAAVVFQIPLDMTSSVSMCEMSDGARDREQNEQNTGDDDVMDAHTPSRMKDFEQAASSPEVRRVAATL